MPLATAAGTAPQPAAPRRHASTTSWTRRCPYEAGAPTPAAARTASLCRCARERPRPPPGDPRPPSTALDLDHRPQGRRCGRRGVPSGAGKTTLAQRCCRFLGRRVQYAYTLASAGDSPRTVRGQRPLACRQSGLYAEQDAHLRSVRVRENPAAGPARRPAGRRTDGRPARRARGPRPRTPPWASTAPACPAGMRRRLRAGLQRAGRASPSWSSTNPPSTWTSPPPTPSPPTCWPPPRPRP